MLKTCVSAFLLFQLLAVVVLAKCPAVDSGIADACSICGEGLCVENPHGTFEEADSKCGDLQYHGYKGSLSPSDCRGIQELIFDQDSGCQCGTNGSEEYKEYEDYWAFRESNERTLVIIAGITGIISVVSSSLVILLLRRSKKGFSNISNRLLLGLAISDIIFTLDYILFQNSGSNFKGDPNYIVGFIKFFGLYCSQGYMASLNLHYFMLVKYEKNKSIRKKAEPYLHLVPIVFGIIMSTILIITKQIVQYEGHYLIYIGNSIGLALQYITMAYLFLVIIIILASLALMYKKIREQEKRNKRYGLGTLRKSVRSARLRMNEESTESSTGCLRRPFAFISICIKEVKKNKKTVKGKLHSQLVLQRAFQYSSFYVLTWLPLFIVFSLASGRNETLYRVAMYLAAILTPLQGFWNLCIFMFPKIKAARNGPNGTKISWVIVILVVFSCKKSTSSSNVRTPAVAQTTQPTTRTTQTTATASNSNHVDEEKSEIRDPESLQEPSSSYARNEDDKLTSPKATETIEDDL